MTLGSVKFISKTYLCQFKQFQSYFGPFLLWNMYNHHLLYIVHPADSTSNSNIFPLIKIFDIFNTNRWDYD